MCSIVIACIDVASSVIAVAFASWLACVYASRLVSRVALQQRCCRPTGYSTRC